MNFITTGNTFPGRVHFYFQVVKSQVPPGAFGRDAAAQGIVVGERVFLGDSCRGKKQRQKGKKQGCTYHVEKTLRVKGINAREADTPERPGFNDEDDILPNLKQSKEIQVVYNCQFCQKKFHTI